MHFFTYASKFETGWEGSHDNLKEGFTNFVYLSSRDSIGVHAKNLLFHKTANRAGCIFSLLLNAFEWRLRFKI
jgi:hypothetical protein